MTTSPQHVRPLIFVGPSGIGKGTIEKEVMMAHPERFAYSISHTTRNPREHEVDGRDYHFITREKFEQDIKDNKFLEYCEIHGNLYGTSFQAIKSVFNSGRICILDLNIDGAISAVKANLNPYIIFLKPVSIEALRERLTRRGTEPESVIDIRMRTAETELKRCEELKQYWSLVIVNDKLNDTLQLLHQKLSEVYGYDPMV